MLTKTRVTGAMDTKRLGKAVSYPGIDPRTWVALAIVKGFRVDADKGIFVDITLMPSELEETARVGAVYSGNGFGLYAPLEAGDEVLVTAPDGDPDNGLVIVGRMWSSVDKPPVEAASNVQDVVLVVKEGKTLRLSVSGAGEVIIASGTKGAARLDDEVEIPGSGLQAVLDTRYALAGVPLPLTNVTGNISTASGRVKIG